MGRCLTRVLAELKLSTPADRCSYDVMRAGTAASTDSRWT